MNEKIKSRGSAIEKKVKNLFWALASSLIPKTPSGAFKPGPSPSVLVLRPDRLGDLLLSAPAIRSLEKVLGPKTRLTIVAGERNEGAARFLFPKAKLLVFKKTAVKRLPLFWELWRDHFDAVIDLHSYPFSTTSALMTLLSRAPARVGFWDKGENKTLSRQVFNFGAPPPGEGIHESRKGLLLVGRLVSAAGKAEAEWLAFPPSPPRIVQAVNGFFKKIGVGPKTKLIAIHPTLQKADNRWSQDHYLKLVRLISGSPNVKIVVVHGLGEESELERFKVSLKGLNNVFVLPESDLLFILEASKRFRYLVCNDSGLMHLAAGVTKIFAIFGPSDPRRWGPLPMGAFHHRIFQAKDRICDSIKPEKVVQAIHLKNRINHGLVG